MAAKGARASTKSAKRGGSRRRRTPATAGQSTVKRAAVPRLPPGAICAGIPICAELDIQARRTTILLIDVELLDPDSPGAVWTKVTPAELSPDAFTSAMIALQAVARPMRIQSPCQPGCHCVLRGRWGPWGPWATYSISNGFTNRADTLEVPITRHYRANGTVLARTRLQFGTCRK
jgi:hypothetical protein